MTARGHRPCPRGGGGGAHLAAGPALLEEEGREGSAPRTTKRSGSARNQVGTVRRAVEKGKSSPAMARHQDLIGTMPWRDGRRSRCDGAAALVLVNGEKAKNLGLQVLARTRGYADVAQAPELFTEGVDSALLLLIHAHVLKRKKIPYWIWTLTRTNKFSLSRRGRKSDRRGLPRPDGRRAIQPLGGGLRREARRPRCTDDRPGDRDAGGRRAGGPHATVRGEGGFGSTGV